MLQGFQLFIKKKKKSLKDSQYIRIIFPRPQYWEETGTFLHL